MDGPLDMVRLVHGAIREDFRRLEGEASAGAAIGVLSERFAFLRAYLSAHDAGEAAVLLSDPTIVLEEVAAPYTIAHRYVSEALDALGAALAEGDAGAVRRAATHANATVRLHLDMEDEHLLPLCRSHLDSSQELRTLGKLAEHIPPELSMRTVSWMPPLLSPADRETLVRFYMANIPEGPRETVLNAVRTALSPEEWHDLRNRVPELEA